MAKFVCAWCGMAWREGRTICFNCDSTGRVEVPDDTPEPQVSAIRRYSKPLGERIRETQEQRQQQYPSPFMDQVAEPVEAVRVIDVRLSWGSVFDLIFKFTVAFLMIDAVVIIVLALVIVALVG